MFDHIAIGVRDLHGSARFFLEALAPLHARVVMHEQRAVHYHEGYYAAFVIAPEGHNVEMVCRSPEP